MKLISFTSIFVLFSFVGLGTINDLQEAFSKIEKEQILTNLELKRIRCKGKKRADYDLQETAYFEIIPPVYKEVLDTITTFAPENFVPEIRAGYELVTEQRYKKKAGFKWMQTKKGLSFKQEPNEFTFMTLVVLNIYPTHSSEQTDWELINHQRKRAYDMIQKGKTTTVFKTQIIQKNGYLKRISKAEFLSSKNKQEIIVLEKGFWRMNTIKLQENQ